MFIAVNSSPESIRLLDGDAWHSRGRSQCPAPDCRVHDLFRHSTVHSVHRTLLPRCYAPSTASCGSSLRQCNLDHGRIARASLQPIREGIQHPLQHTLRQQRTRTAGSSEKTCKTEDGLGGRWCAGWIWCGRRGRAIRTWSSTTTASREELEMAASDPATTREWIWTSSASPTVK